jgi:hypothetical protein
MSVNYSIGQSVVESSLQRVDALAPRNPAEELIFGRADVVKMVETSDGSVHYFDETGNPVAVMNVDGSVYLWDGDGWQNFEIDDVIAAVSDESSEVDISESKSIESKEDVEYAAMACQSTPDVFSEDSMMSIDPEDLYCDDEQCHMPDYDEGGATERSAQRFADSAPTSGGSSSAAKSGTSSAKKTEDTPVPEAQPAAAKDDEVQDVDYADAPEGSGLVEDLDIDDVPIWVEDESVGSADVAQSTAAESSSEQEMVPISSGDSAPIDLSAAIYNSNADVQISNLSTTAVGSKKIDSGLAKSGVPVIMESGAAVMFERSGADLALDDSTTASGMPGIASSDSSLSSALGVDVGGSSAELGAVEMVGREAGASESGVASRAVSGGLRSAGESSSGRRGPSLKLKDQIVPNADPLTDTYAVSGMGGTPHMSSIPGVLGMSEMGAYKETGEVKAPQPNGERNRDSSDQEEHDGNSDQLAELFEEDEEAVELVG